MEEAVMHRLTQSDLDQFTGTAQWFRHPLMRNVTYTEGVHFLAEQGGAYWLVDKIATLQMLPQVRREAFQIWTLQVSDGKATLTCTDGNDGPASEVYAEKIDFTDFPLERVEIWVEGGVILLPREH
jgi:hypothetical protein